MKVIFSEIFIILIIGGFILEPIIAANDMEIEFENIETHGDRETFDPFLKVNRISRGVFGLDGNITVKNDITDDYKVQTIVSISDLGQNDYKLSPMLTSLGNLTLSNFMNNIYKTFVMPVVKDCSNFPQFDDVFVPPLKPDLYYIDKCNPDINKMVPSYVVEGKYKIETEYFTKNEHFGIILYFTIKKS